MREHALHCTTVDQQASGFSLVRRLVENWKARRTIHTLNQYDDFMLRDIGITRGDLRWAESLPLGQNATRALRNQLLNSR
jgi:uncharacterized protein YjiS (DUF1127 family)